MGNRIGAACGQAKDGGLGAGLAGPSSDMHSTRRFCYGFGAILGLFLLAAAGAKTGVAKDVPPTFKKLITEAGIVYRAPKGFKILAPRADALLPYEHAVRHRSGLLEIRYAIRPLARMVTEYNDPHSAAPEPEHLFPLMFDSITNVLSGGRHSLRREYSSDEARERFNADWAAASVFDVEPEFAGPYREALLLALHKNGKADAYAVFLYKDPAAAKAMINTALTALSFAP